MSLITIYCKRGEQPWRCQEFSALIPNPPMHALIKDYMVQGGSELSQGLVIRPSKEIGQKWPQPGSMWIFHCKEAPCLMAKIKNPKS